MAVAMSRLPPMSPTLRRFRYVLLFFSSVDDSLCRSLLSLVAFSPPRRLPFLYHFHSSQLPDPAGRAGGACTSAMLKVLYADHKAPDEDLSFQEVLLEMREILKESQYTQIPQLTSSRPLDVTSPFEIVPKGNTGTRRAVIIGINYVGQ